MAGDGDDEGFGDFNFVTAVDPNPKINGRNSTVSDDDWGDFVTDNTSQIETQVARSNGFTNAQSPPAQIPVGQFGVFNIANGSATVPPDSKPIQIDTKPEKVDKTRWVKGQGALPLSLFGEEQEEDDSGAGESRIVEVANGSNKNMGFVEKGLNSNVNIVGMNDLIANLYVQNPNIVAENGLQPNLAPVGPNSAINCLNFSANALDLKFDSLVPKENGNFGGLNLGSHGVDLKLDGVDPNSNTSGLKLDGEEENGDFDEDDEGWEFKAADSERRDSTENFKEQVVVEVAGSKVESNAFIHPGIQENTGGTGLTWGFGVDAPKFNNGSVPSNESSHGNGEWGFSFDFNPSPVKQVNFFSGLHSNSKQNKPENVSNSFPVDENVWEFKDALPETGSKHKLEEAKAATPTGLGAHSLDGVRAGPQNDLFAGFDGISQKSGENNFAFPFIPNSVTKDGVSSGSYPSGKRDDIAAGLSWSPADNHVESDGSFWEFKDAFSESESKIEGESVSLPTNIKLPAVSDKMQHNHVTLENQRQALPLSIFGDEELETDGSSILQDISTHTAASQQINSPRRPAPNISITDLISSLYSQVDQNTNKIQAPKAAENPMHPPPEVLESDDFGDDSWEFKHAVLGDQSQTSISLLEDSPENALASVQNNNTILARNAADNHMHPPPEVLEPDIDDDSWEFKDAVSNDLGQNTNTIRAPKAAENPMHPPPVSESDVGDDSWEFKHAALGDQGQTSISHVEDSPQNALTTVQNNNTILAPNTADNHMHPSPGVLEPDVGDDSSEFKDAVSNDQGQTFITDLEDSPRNSLTKVQLDNFVDFYCKLKDESYFLALNYLDNKKAQTNATLSDEDTTEDALEEVQKLYNELHQDNMISDQFHPTNSSTRNAYLDEIRKILQDPHFNVLESEYQLSQRLSLAKKDLKSAIKLSRHAASTLRILRLGSNEQYIYISTWCQIASICAQELKHSSLIWRQSIEKNVQNQILSYPKGKRYVVALGEIYRVVLVLGASAKLYKPWTLLHSSYSSSLFALLSECSTLWSSSGLDEALKSITDASDLKYDGTVDALLDSMTSINHLDALALQNHVLKEQQPTCSLSLLTAGAVPGIKMVKWNGKHYLLTLANLWTNLISPDPPQLPDLKL